MSHGSPSSSSAPVRSFDRGAPLASASSRLRRRVLAGVRGEHPATARQPRRRRRALLLPFLSLLFGVALGAILVSALSSSPRTENSSTRSLKASLRTLDSHAELSVSGMPEPPVGEVYEVWLLRSGSASPRPTDALFTVTKAGSATVEVPGGNTGNVREVLVTSEPLGGSTIPSGPVVLRVKSPGAS